MTDGPLAEKTERYRDMLDRALATAEPANGGGSGDLDGDEVVTMARAYLDDGEHFLERGDDADALAAFSYGHGWLDAGVRAGLVSVDDTDLFTIDG